jgi:hypothetical protein
VTSITLSSGFTGREMEDDKVGTVNRCIRVAAQQAAAVNGLSAAVIEQFLRTGEETWKGAGSGRLILNQLKQDEAYTRTAKSALRTLFNLLADLLPAEPRLAPPVAPETIRSRINPTVKGLVQRDWQEIALRKPPHGLSS